MADEPKTTNYGKAARGEAGIPTSVVAALLASLVSGGAGSAATSWSVSGTMKEGQLRMEARLDALSSEVRRLSEQSAASVLRLEVDGREREGRIRALELWRAQVEARVQPPR